MFFGLLTLHVLIPDPKFDVNLSVILSVNGDRFHVLVRIKRIKREKPSHAGSGRIILRIKYEKRVIQQTIPLRVVQASLCLAHLALSIHLFLREPVLCVFGLHSDFA